MTEEEKQHRAKGKEKMVLTVEVSPTVHTSETSKKNKANEANEAADDWKDMEIVAGEPTKIVKISIHLAPVIKKLLVMFLREKYDVFTWGLWTFLALQRN